MPTPTPEPSPSPALGRRRGWLSCLILICVLALSVRLFGLDFGRALPYVSHPDESTQYAAAARMLSTGTANPRFFKYPSLAIYIETVGVAIACELQPNCSLSKLAPATMRATAVGKFPDAASVLGGRTAAAIVSCIAVPAVFWLALLLTGARWLALLTALTLALHPEHARFSQYLTVDATGAGFALLAAACVEAWSQRESRRLLLAGALASGAAISSKYSYVFWAAGLALWIAWRLLRARRMRELCRTPALFGGVCLAAFVLTSPYVLLTPRQAAIDFLSEVHHYGSGHLGLSENAAVWYVRYLGTAHAPALLGGLFGLLLIALRKGKPGGAFALALSLYAAAISAQSVYFDRNALALLSGLPPLAALSAKALLDYASRRLQAPQTVAAVVIALALLGPQFDLLRQLRERTLSSPRAQAQAWSSGMAPELAKLPDLRQVLESYTIWLPESTHTVYERTLSDRPSLVHDADLVWIGSGSFRRIFKAGRATNSARHFYRQLLDHPGSRCFRGSDTRSMGESSSEVCVIPLSDRGRELILPNLRIARSVSSGRELKRALE